MDVRFEVPCTWPSPQQWRTFVAAAWQPHLSAIRTGSSEDLGVSADGRLLLDREPQPVVLSSGAPLGRGSSYCVDLGPRVTGVVGGAQIGLDGRLEASVSLARNPGDAWLQIDDIDIPLSGRSRSTLRHVTWDVEVDLNAAEVVAARGRLDFAEGRLRLTRRPQSLVLEADIHGLGWWRPVVAAFLARAANEADSEIDERDFRELAAEISAVAADPVAAADPALRAQRKALRADQQRDEAAAKAEAVRWLLRPGLALVQDRVAQATRQVAAKPFWRSKGTDAWLAAWEALPQAQWPPAPETVGHWAVVEADVVAAVSQAAPRDRDAVLAVAIESARDRYDGLDPEPPSPASSSASVTTTITTTPPDPWWTRIRDEDLDLAWLHSPITMARHAGAENEVDFPDAPPEER